MLKEVAALSKPFWVRQKLNSKEARSEQRFLGILEKMGLYLSTITLMAALVHFNRCTNSLCCKKAEKINCEAMLTDEQQLSPRLNYEKRLKD